MKGKGTLSLMEQSIMLLVFAVATALCLKGFLLADMTARENAALDDAVLQARNVAEQLKHTRGEWDGRAQTFADEAQTVVVRVEKTAVEGLGKAEVTVVDEGGAVLVSIPVAWQEVDEHEA